MFIILLLHLPTCIVIFCFSTKKNCSIHQLDVKKIALQRAETEYDYIKEHVRLPQHFHFIIIVGIAMITCSSVLRLCCYMRMVLNEFYFYRHMYVGNGVQDKRVRLKPVEGCTIRKHRVNKTDGAVFNRSKSLFLSKAILSPLELWMSLQACIFLSLVVWFICIITTYRLMA